MKFGNFVTGALLIVLATTAALYACNSTSPAKAPTLNGGTLQSQSNAAIATRSADDSKPESLNDAGNESGRSNDSLAAPPQQAAIDQLMETGKCPGCDLKEANLQGLNLEGVNLEGANLEGANLTFARLENAILKRANLKRANLEGASLGCNISLSLPHDQGGNGFSVRNHSTGTGNSNVDINVNVSKGDAIVDLYASGNVKECFVLQGADLKEAKLPDGTVYR
jgi:hypothetical protein